MRIQKFKRNFSMRDSVGNPSLENGLPLPLRQSTIVDIALFERAVDIIEDEWNPFVV